MKIQFVEGENGDSEPQKVLPVKKIEIEKNESEKPEKSTKKANIEDIILKTIETYNSQRNDKQPIKDTIKKFIKAVNYGHKRYEKYGFKDNHEFLTEIDRMIEGL